MHSCTIYMYTCSVLYLDTQRLVSRDIYIHRHIFAYLQVYIINSLSLVSWFHLLLLLLLNNYFQWFEFMSGVQWPCGGACCQQWQEKRQTKFPTNAMATLQSTTMTALIYGAGGMMVMGPAVSSSALTQAIVFWFHISPLWKSGRVNEFFS